MLRRNWNEFKYNVKVMWAYLTVVEKITIVLIGVFVAISIASVF